MVITFRREGYGVASAESGHQALELLAQRPFDLIVTDLRMTGMSGIDVLRTVAEIISHSWMDAPDSQDTAIHHGNTRRSAAARLAGAQGKQDSYREKIGCNSHTDTDHRQLRIGTTLSRAVTSAL